MELLAQMQGKEVKEVSTVNEEVEKTKSTVPFTEAASSEIDVSGDSSSIPKVVRPKMKSKCKIVHPNLLPKIAEIKEHLMVEAAASVKENLDTTGLIFPTPPATPSRGIKNARQQKLYCEDLGSRQNEANLRNKKMVLKEIDKARKSSMIMEEEKEWANKISVLKKEETEKALRICMLKEEETERTRRIVMLKEMETERTGRITMFKEEETERTRRISLLKEEETERAKWISILKEDEIERVKRISKLKDEETEMANRISMLNKETERAKMISMSKKDTVNASRDNYFAESLKNIAMVNEVYVDRTGLGSEKEKYQPILSFHTSSLSPLLLQNMSRYGMKYPTVVQSNAIPIILEGRDLMTCANVPRHDRDAAYLLPIIQKLLTSQRMDGRGSTIALPQALIISPTRDLANQTFKEATQLSQGSMVKPALVIGGIGNDDLANKLIEGCHIVSATLGKLMSLVYQGRVSFAEVKFLVLVDTDVLLDTGSIDKFKECLEDPTMPKMGERQTLMFSRTFPDYIQITAMKFLRDYIFMTVGWVVGEECKNTPQNFYKVMLLEKAKKLLEIMHEKDIDTDLRSKKRTLILVQHNRNADFLNDHLAQEGFLSTTIHSDCLRLESDESLYNFRVGKKPILVATSLAVLGLEFTGVAHVINYDMPDEAGIYFQRIKSVQGCEDGAVGKVSSFYDPEKDYIVADELVKNLTSCNVRLPAWLLKEMRI